LELGKGFAFVGENYKLEVGNSSYFLDLLFYHIPLKRYVVIELKTGAFKPEYAGKMNFYLSAVDDLLKTSNENNSLGLILCKQKESFVVEYALKDVQKPIGIASYKLTPELRDALPTTEELQRYLSLHGEETE
jgi:hypothetical protein